MWLTEVEYENQKKSKDFWKRLILKSLGTPVRVHNLLAVPVLRKKTLTS